MFFEMPANQWSHQIPALCKLCVRIQCTQLSKRQERNFQICQRLLRRHRSCQEQMGSCFHSFVRDILTEELHLLFNTQVILIFTVKSSHSQFFWTFPFPSVPFLSVLKVLHKNYPGVFIIAMWWKPSQAYIKSQFYHPLAVRPWANCLTSHPQFLPVFLR